jgi:two-component system, cell cycle sensor histidine kinase PleC
MLAAQRRPETAILESLTLSGDAAQSQPAPPPAAPRNPVPDAIPHFGHVTRALGRLGPIGATALLVTIAIILALGVYSIVVPLLGIIPDAASVMAAAVITVIVATPLVLYSQTLIRSLASSRRKMRQMTEELALALGEKENAYQNLSRFLSGMSHELRTPLNAIIGFSDILSNQRFGLIGNEKYVEYAGDIHASADHLLGVINSILDMAKIQAGQTELGPPTGVSVGELFHLVSRLLAPLAEQRGVELSMRHPEEELGLFGNEQMLRQILLNIVSNAVKYSPQGGRVTLFSEAGPAGEIALCIADTGIGMSPGEIRIALQPFGQVENVYNRRQGGTGLGLPLVKAMMKLHGGKLRIDSVPEQGTCIRLSFPAERIMRLQLTAAISAPA